MGMEGRGLAEDKGVKSSLFFHCVNNISVKLLFVIVQTEFQQTLTLWGKLALPVYCNSVFFITCKKRKRTHTRTHNSSSANTHIWTEIQITNQFTVWYHIH